MPQMAADASDPTALGRLFHATEAALERRVRLYRRLVIAVVTVGITSAVTALALWKIVPLSGLALWLPLVALYLWLDGRAMARWQTDVLAGWVRGSFELEHLRQGLAVYPRLPRTTLASMLQTLPQAVETGEPLDEDARGRLVAAHVDASRRSQRWGLLGLVAATLAAGGIVSAVLIPSPLPLLALAPVLATRLAASRVRSTR